MSGEQQVRVSSMRIIETIPMALIVAAITSYATIQVQGAQIDNLRDMIRVADIQAEKRSQLVEEKTVSTLGSMRQLIDLQLDIANQTMTGNRDRIAKLAARVRVLESTAIGVPKAQFNPEE